VPTQSQGRRARPACQSPRSNATRRGRVTATSVWVKVECGDELFGWGEAGLSGRELAVAGAVEHFKQFLVGQDGMRVGALWQEMYRSQYFEGGRVLTAAMSAIDIALYDCIGKKLNVPVYQLLGGAHRHHIPCMVSCASDVETVKARVAEGWLNIRMSPGDGRPDPENDPHDMYEPRISIARSIEQFTACRAAVGPAPTLGTDYHTRLSVAECASLLQKMPIGTLDWIEGIQ
jgi:galactonate dehydratase